MLRDTIVDSLVMKLGDREDLRTRIISEMQFCQTFRLEQNGRFTPWFMLTEYASINTTIDESRVVLPDDFLMEDEESPLFIRNDAGTGWDELVKGDGGKFLAANRERGKPEAYTVNGLRIELFPTPDAEYQMQWRYIAAQPVLDTNVENSWLKYAGDLVEAMVGERMASDVLRNEKLAATFRDAKASSWDRLYVMHEARAHTNRQYKMDGD